MRHREAKTACRSMKFVFFNMATSTCDNEYIYKTHWQIEAIMRLLSCCWLDKSFCFVKLVCEGMIKHTTPPVSHHPPSWLWWVFVEHNPTLLYVRPLTNLSPRPSGLWIKGPFHLSSLDEWSSCLAAAQSPASALGTQSGLVRLSHVWLTGSPLIGGHGIFGSLHWLKPRGDVL